MSYTFDEAFEQVDDNAFEQWYELLEKLKQEYAPTIEMTKKQYNYIIHLIQQGKELGATFIEFWEVYKFACASKKVDPAFDIQEQAMQAWLHPETIKVIYDKELL